MTRKVLMVTTSTARAEDKGQATGFDWMSVAIPYWRLREAGVSVGFASIRGGKPPGDPDTAQPGEADERAGAVDMFLGDEAAIAALSHSVPMSEIDAGEWDAVLITDGTGGYWDLGQSGALAEVVGAIWRHGRIVAAIGVGTAGLVAVTDTKGRPLVTGLRLTTVPGEAAGGSEADTPAPPDLHAQLRALGANLWVAPKGEPPAVVEEGRLITGQDARAAADVTLQLLDALDIYAGESGAAGIVEGTALEQDGSLLSQSDPGETPDAARKRAAPEADRK